MTQQTTDDWMQELAVRETDGLEVALLWNPAEDEVLLNVRDRRTGEWFLGRVDHAEALDAFRHPFAHAARRHRDAGAIAAAA